MHSTCDQHQKDEEQFLSHSHAGLTDSGLGPKGEVPGMAYGGVRDVACSKRTHTSCMWSGSNCGGGGGHAVTITTTAQLHVINRLASDRCLQDLNQFHRDRSQGTVTAPGLLQLCLAGYHSTLAQEEAK